MRLAILLVSDSETVINIVFSDACLSNCEVVLREANELLWIQGEAHGGPMGGGNHQNDDVIYELFLIGP